MFKGSWFAVAAVMFFTIICASPAWSNDVPPTPADHFYGDANGDLSVTGTDDSELSKYVLKKPYTFDTLQPKNSLQDWNTCDLNSDRACTGSDEAIVTQIILKKPVSISDKPWVLENMNLSLTGIPSGSWTPFNVNLYSTYNSLPSGRPGVSVMVEIEGGSTATGQLKGRSCSPAPGSRDQAAAPGAQCALSVTQTNWDPQPGQGLTESGDYILQVKGDTTGELNLKISVAAKPALDIPATSLHLNVGIVTVGVSSISAGDSHTCAVTTSGGAKCWGRNKWGMLGDGTTTEQHIPVDAVGLTSGVAALSAGSLHTCVVTTSGGAKCWGFNGQGELGDGTYDNRTTPVDVTGLTSGVAAISAGVTHTCVVTTSGGAKCWGTNWEGELGDGTTIDRNTPVDVSGLTSGVAAISAGAWHTCAVTTSGGAKCWGANWEGELGDGTETDRWTPVDVTGLTSGVAAISAGQYCHTCAITTSGGAKCWGDNAWGQLGDGTDSYRTTPVDVSGLTSGVAAISAGDYHTCAMTTSGGAKCWGANHNGQLGDGTTIERDTPVDVSGLTSGVIGISGVDHTCAVTTSGGAKCWGDNEYGELGDGTTTDRWTPVDVVWP